MASLAEVFSPSFLLFPALVGSLILGAVCPQVGLYLLLRRTVLLALTLPQVAAAGVAFTLWLGRAGGLAEGAGEPAAALAGSLLFTFAALGLLGYLERLGKGMAEARLAVAYALAGSLTILFIVFNPAAEVEILGLLKGEVIALSLAQSTVLASVFGFVLLAMIYFRREFLLSSFDPDLAFLLKGGHRAWDVALYFLAGLSIAVGVIMAGPLLVFGFMILPPLAARPLAKRMASFAVASSLFGLVMALFGFCLALSMDLPLGPTDVALGCGLVLAAYALSGLLRRARVGWLAALVLFLPGCTPAIAPFPSPPALSGQTVWLFGVANTTGRTLRLPPGNPLESLAEMAGKGSPEARPTVMGLLRDALREELEKRGFAARLAEERDSRLGFSPPTATPAVEAARAAGLKGFLLVSAIERWEPGEKLVRALVDFKLLRADDGALVWQARVRRALPTPGATHLAEAYRDGVAALVRDLFAR